MNNLTLVAYYGQKQETLNGLFTSCIESISKSTIADFFVPYSSSQIHATIIGLEWFEDSGRSINRNHYLKYKRKSRLKFNLLPEILNKAFPQTIRIGGFSDTFSDFTSFGRIPYERSFQIHRTTNKVILIGWPHSSGNFQKESLAHLRSTMERKCNISHKYPRDNDLYFVLGKIRKPNMVKESHFEQSLQNIEDIIRAQLCRNPIDLTIDKENLSFVSYSTEDLNESTSRVFPLEQYYNNNWPIDKLNNNK